MFFFCIFEIPSINLLLCEPVVQKVSSVTIEIFKPDVEVGGDNVDWTDLQQQVTGQFGQTVLGAGDWITLWQI